MIDAIAQTQAIEQEIKQLTRAKANALHDALADIEMLLRTVADAWNEVKDKTREKLEQRAAAHGVKFDDEGCLGYQDEHSVEGLLWWLGNHLPLYNESCEPIVDYQIVQDEAEVATWVARQRRYISVTYQEQDGFEFDLPLELMDAFDYADIDQWKEQFVNYMKKTLDKALAKAQEEVFPQMDRVASAPITPEMLARQAAALGFDLVPKKVKKSVKKA